MKEKILDKAKELFCQFGYKTVTMDEVAAQLGISKKTLYEVYDSKSKLIQAVVDSLQQDIDAEVEASIDEKNNAIEQVFSTMRHMDRLFGLMNSRQLQRELKKYYFKISQNLNYNIRERIKKYLYRNIQQGIAEGLYRSELDMQFMFHFFIGVVQNEVSDEIYPENKFTTKEIGENHMEYIVRIMATPKGVEMLEKIINPEK
uniref:TetR/AcrR family transcriptional regulator n=1 Tax=Ornithobacterium rhinotracheale TaxID=28251 RepID=UPI00129C53DE|nr:TetR/AcrR family transcriptional regulator [Ornithobacterium rhinotracheale]